MKVKILNRNFDHPADGWYMIERAGEHPNARAKIVQIIDDKACQSIVNRFNQEADKPDFAGMLIDHDHLKHDETQSTESFGWLMRLQNRADGIYGQIRWTDTGQAAVDGGRFRFFSTEYDPADFQVLNDKKPPQVRPLRLDGLTLTNMNNNKGQKPITNRNDMNKENENDTAPEAGAGVAAIKASQAAHDSSDKADSAPQHEDAAVMHRKAAKAQEAAGHDATAEYHQDMADTHDKTAEGIRACTAKNRLSGGRLANSEHQPQTAEIPMKSVIALLGLAADASEPDVLAAVKKITNRVIELEKTQIEADLETFKDRIPEGQQEFIKSLLVTNREATVKYLAAQPVLNGKTARPVAPGKIHNRDTSSPINTDPGAGVDEMMERLEKQREEIEKIRNTNRSLTYEQARNQVRNRKPELFGLPARGASAN